MNCSSIGMLAVISRVEEETLIIRGWSEVAWEGAQSLTAVSSVAMTRGEI